MDDERPSPLPSPDRSLSKLLKTGNRKGDTNVESSAASLAPSEPSSETGGLRKSFDRSLDRFKDRRRDSTDKDGDSSQSSSRRSGLSKLVPKRSRRRKKDQRSQSPYGQVGNGSSLLNVPGNNNSKLQLQSGNASTDSLGNPKSGTSSLLTDDSDPEAPSSRPELVSRASHKGFLTFSSPLIAAEAVETPAFDSPSPHHPRSPSLINDNDYTVRRTQTSPDRRPRVDRPPSSQSSKPSIKVTTFPPDVRPQTPRTYITPPTPSLQHSVHHLKSDSDSSLPLPVQLNKPISSTPKESLAHRRVRSTTSAGKKGSFTSPLTPTAEEAKTPGGSVIQPSASSSFFSGFLTAAQNAAAQLGNTLSNQPAQGRPKTATHGGDAKINSVERERGKDTSTDGTSESELRPEPAIATLGSGNLSLTHLGITDHKPELEDMATNTETATAEIQRLGHNASASREEASAADAVSAAYSSTDPGEKPVPVATDALGGRPRSISSIVAGTSGDQTPPRSLINTLDNDGGSILRANSVRSRLSGHRRKHRNSSAAGAGAIAAAVAASHGALANPASRRPTGFQVANSRRNKEFHQLFKSVPDDDHLVEDYSAALQRDILLHGRFYISERHICFSSNILGWVTNLVISFDEVIAMEKKSTAMIFPNAIIIQTLHAKNVFASFISRDPTYDLLIRIWKIGHPNIKATETGHALDEGGNMEKVENGDGVESDDEDDESSGDEEDGFDVHGDASSSIGRPASLASDAMDTHRQVSKTMVAGVGPAAMITTSPNKSPDGGSPSAMAGAVDFPGPAQHAPTECSDTDTHYEKQCLDTIIPAPLGKVYSLMFGPMSGTAMRKFLLDDQKSLDLQLEDDKKGMGEDTKSFSFSYIKPLNAPIGPKQTSCLVTQSLDAFDLEKAVSVTCSTSTPDVPSGNVFVVKTRYCLTWGPSNQTRVLMSAAVEWSGKSWLKGPIEKGASDGQMQYGKDLASFLKAQVATRSPVKGGAKGKGKGKKRKATGDAGEDAARMETPIVEKGASSWGSLEPLHAILGPLGSLAGDFVSPVSVLSVLLLIISFLWFRQVGSTTSVDPMAPASLAAHSRMAAYDQLWKREETQMWDWLEARLGMEGVAAASSKPAFGKRGEDGSASMAASLHQQRMSERQVDEAIRTTEERLKELKMMVERQREHERA